MEAKQPQVMREKSEALSTYGFSTHVPLPSPLARGHLIPSLLFPWPNHQAHRKSIPQAYWSDLA